MPRLAGGASPGAVTMRQGEASGAVTQRHGEVSRAAGDLLWPRQWLSAGVCELSPGRRAGRRVPPLPKPVSLPGQLCGVSRSRTALAADHFRASSPKHPKFSHRGVMCLTLLLPPLPGLVLSEEMRGLKSTRAL